MKFTMASFALLLSSGLAVAATFPDDYSRVLLPIAIPIPVVGAFGSEWLTHVAITNTGAEPVSVVGWDPFCQIECDTPPVPPNITFYPYLDLDPSILAGYFLWIERGREADVHISLRVEDIAHETQGWGTDLPVVREADFVSTVAIIEDIPLSPGFRSNLRVYDLDPLTQHSAHIKLYSVNTSLNVPTGAQVVPDQLLYDETIPLSPIFDESLGRPGMIYLDLSSLAQLAGAQVVRAEISPADGDKFPFWALASTTNNSTQQITTFSPR